MCVWSSIKGLYRALLGMKINVTEFPVSLNVEHIVLHRDTCSNQQGMRRQLAFGNHVNIVRQIEST